MSIVSVAAAKAHLNITDNSDDVLIADKIAAAEAHVEGILGRSLTTDFNTVPDDVREAVLQLVGHFYENREATLVGVSAEEVPFGVWELLAPHREWVF